MVSSYDVSTVVSRSYLVEQVQNGLQKGQEQHNAQFLQEFQKNAEKKSQSVQKTEQADNPTISKEAARQIEEKEKREKRKRNQDKYNDSEDDSVMEEDHPHHFIDVEA